MLWPLSTLLRSQLSFGEEEPAGTNSGGREPEPPCTAFVDALPELAEARAGLLERVRKGEAPSFAVGAIRKGEVIWAEGMGWADRDMQTMATPERRSGYP